MVRQFFTVFHKEWSGLHEAAYLLGLFAFLSQVLALFRDRLLAGSFGAGANLDIYYTAFRIPDFLYIAVASLVSVTVLVPFFIKHLETENTGSAKKFINDVFTVFFLVLVGVSIVTFLLMPWLVKLIAPGFLSSQHETLIFLSRVLLLSPLLLGLSNLFGSITQSYRQFFVYALSPILYNIGIIVGIIFWSPAHGIAGVVYGVLLGALLHLLVQIPAVAKKGLLPSFSFRINLQEIKEVTLLSLPRTFVLSTQQLIMIIFLALASLLGEGAISVLKFSFNLQSVPLSIIGVSYSVAAFPTLAQLFSNGDKEAFAKQIMVAAKHIIFWSLPVLVLFIVLRAQIVRSVLGTGAFGWTETRLTAAALALFAVSIVAQSLVFLFVRGYYASNHTQKPVIINSVAAIITVALAFFLLKFFEANNFFRFFVEDLFRVSDVAHTSVLMLPLAFSIGSIVNALLFWVIFKKDFPAFSMSMAYSLYHSFAGSVAMGFVAYQMLGVLDNFFDVTTFWGILLQGFFAGVAGIIVGVCLLYVLENKEVREIWESFHHKFWKAKVVAPDQPEL
ncbi:MAG: murein biosynthesis integral membrane protein MurJ [Candidatus Lloydbacteria bacterium]|nr:murein biosynthesis integral membrane protein MurJ [Candidatus Lloydbacteria bacterium]